MNNLNKIQRVLSRGAVSIAVVAVMAMGAWAQDTTVKDIKHGAPSYSTQVKNAEVVYVSGNDLVLKLENGKVEHLVVPDSDVFTIDGKDVSVYDLTPGTKITQTIATSTVPRYVQTIRTIKGKIAHVNPPNYVVVTLPDGKNQGYSVPSDTDFKIGHENRPLHERHRPRTAWDLRKGMNINATIITDDTENVIERNKSIVGQAPPPATPKEIGILLISRPTLRIASLQPAPAPALVAETEQPASLSASAEQPAAVLPATGTLLPLVGLLGALGIATSLGMASVRKAVRS
jgi:hypothetical protein